MKGAGVEKYRIGVWLTAMAVMAVVGCVKIETGQTPEEARESTDARAKNVRAEWAARLQSATPAQKAAMVVTFVNSVAERYLDYGDNVSKQWRDAIAGRKQDVPAEEMRRMVGAWTKDEQPILLANEDNIEYGTRQLKEARYLSRAGTDLLDQFVAEYYNTYSAVFLPSGTVDDYETRVAEQRRKVQRLTDELKSLLGLP